MSESVTFVEKRTLYMLHAKDRGRSDDDDVRPLAKITAGERLVFPALLDVDVVECPTLQLRPCTAWVPDLDPEELRSGVFRERFSDELDAGDMDIALSIYYRWNCTAAERILRDAYLYELATSIVVGLQRYDTMYAQCDTLMQHWGACVERLAKNYRECAPYLACWKRCCGADGFRRRHSL